MVGLWKILQDVKLTAISATQRWNEDLIGEFERPPQFDYSSGEKVLAALSIRRLSGARTTHFEKGDFAKSVAQGETEKGEEESESEDEEKSRRGVVMHTEATERKKTFALKGEKLANGDMVAGYLGYLPSGAEIWKFGLTWTGYYGFTDQVYKDSRVIVKTSGAKAKNISFLLYNPRNKNSWPACKTVKRWQEDSEHKEIDDQWKKAKEEKLAEIGFVSSRIRFADLPHAPKAQTKKNSIREIPSVPTLKSCSSPTTVRELPTSPTTSPTTGVRMLPTTSVRVLPTSPTTGVRVLPTSPPTSVRLPGIILLFGVFCVVRVG